MLKKLGSGATAEVFIAENRQNQPVALKVFKEDDSKSSVRNKEIVKRELKYAMEVSGEGTSSDIAMRPISYSFPNMIAYELAENGNFLDYLQEGGAMPRRIANAYSIQLVKLVAELHRRGVCHRDLKLENLVLDQAWDLKLIDFGLACDLTGTNQRGFCYRGEKVGTEGFMAPEVLLECQYQPAIADIFALGVVIFAIYTGVMPFGKAM